MASALFRGMGEVEDEQEKWYQTRSEALARLSDTGKLRICGLIVLFSLLPDPQKPDRTRWQMECEHVPTSRGCPGKLLGLQERAPRSATSVSLLRYTKGSAKQSGIKECNG
jgi:hypothetical protein